MKRVRLVVQGNERETHDAAHKHGVPFVTVTRLPTVTIGEAVSSDSIRKKIAEWYAEVDTRVSGTLLCIGMEA